MPQPDLAQKKKGKHRSIYAAGYYAGLKAAEQGDDMNAVKADRLINGLTTIASHVYEAVPIGEEWTLTQIMHEIGRKGKRLDLDKVSGCLDSLRSQGLIKEPKKGSFKRVDFSKPVTLKAVESPVIEPKEQSVRSPIDILSDLTNQADNLIQEANKFKMMTEKAALELEELMQEKSEEAKKLGQLKALLKSIGE